MNPYLLSALSGCVWAGIAYALAPTNMLWNVWGGVVASPLIGLVVGLAARGFGTRRPVIRALIALTSLYAAAALFGMANAAYELAVFDSPPSSPRSPLLFPGQSVFVVWWGMTASGYMLVLWPLSYLNHALVGHSWRRAGRGRVEPSTRPGHQRIPHVQ